MGPTREMDTRRDSEVVLNEGARKTSADSNKNRDTLPLSPFTLVEIYSPFRKEVACVKEFFFSLKGEFTFKGTYIS